MKRYTVRIELHNTEPREYADLHEEMEIRGFTRTIIGKDGHEYRLPHAEYNKIGDETPKSVLAAALEAIRILGKKGMVLVTPSRARFWYGLDEIEDADQEQ